MKKTNDHVCIGIGKGDIPIMPRRLALGLCMEATVLALYERKFPFLPRPLSDGKYALLARILQFAFVLLVCTKIKALSKQELEKVNSGIRFTPAHGLATNGEVYSRSRNPLYLILLWIMASLAILVNSAWFLLATASMWMYLEFWVIPVEELYLIDRFGTDYEDYCSKTSRWLGRLNPSRYANARKRF